MKSYASAKARGLERLRRLIPKNVPPFLVFPADLSPHQIVQSVLSFFTPGDTLIIRSSAAVEDGQNFSYAGKFLSIPGVPLSTQEFCNAWENCVASLAKAKFGDYGSEQMVARQSLGEVIVQRYVKPLYAGVAFVYPIDWERSTVAIGKGEEITSGAGSGETVRCTQLLHSRIAQQNPKICRSLLTILKKIAKLNPAPFDLEFVLTESQVFVVQIRPITARHDGGGFGQLVFDASNIGENYPGLTAPLTYSFISKAYAEVYTGYLRVLQTPEEVVVRQRFALGNLVSYVHGRVFYNLEHWYRLLKMLPFYAVNKKFFETMLSPVKGMSEIDHEESLASLRSSFFFILYVLFPQRLFRCFEQRCQKLFSEFSEQDWKRFTTPELVFRFERLRDSFFSAWAFTIVNDFRVMVFWGLLHALARKVFEKPELYINQLASASRHPESMVPLRELTKLRNHIQGSSALRSLFSQPPGIILNRLRRPEYRRFANKFDRYLQAYGDRSGQELKLEVPKFSEDPGQLLALLKQYCASEIGTPKQARPLSLPKVKQHWLYPILTVVEHIAVAGIYRREKFRLRRGKAYGLARKVFLELGRRMTQDGLLATPSDVFYLTYEELIGLAAFRSLPFSSKKLVLERKRLLEQYDATSSGATRVLAYGWNSPDQELIQDLSQNSLLKGTGTSIVAPVTARIVVMEEFSVHKNLKNAILVTKKTDPGWTVLFPLLKGVITESGSTLSHASIIARELRIPCITGVKGCTIRLKTGDRVTMIPETGEVVIQ